MKRDLTDINSKDGRLFRLRFTVPYQVFTQILYFAELWFPQRERNICGYELAPVYLKLLGTLRMLGKGCSVVRIEKEIERRVGVVMWSEGGWKEGGFGKKSSLRVTTG